MATRGLSNEPKNVQIGQEMSASGMGGMVKGKGGEWEERTGGITQILRTICLKCACHFIVLLNYFLFSWVADGAGLSYMTPLLTKLNVLRQYALYILFVQPASALVAGSAVPRR